MQETKFKRKVSFMRIWEKLLRTKKFSHFPCLILSLLKITLFKKLNAAKGPFSPSNSHTRLLKVGNIIYDSQSLEDALA